MKQLNEREWLGKLKKEGFTELAVHAFDFARDFPDHMHNEYTVHVILDGIVITKDKTGTNNYKKGDRFDIAAGTTHSAKCGPKGCKFIVGIRKR